MALFDSIVNRLFPENKEVSVHEVLKRTPQFIEEYESWKKSDQAREKIDQILRSYHDKLTNHQPILDIELFNSPYGNGFILYARKQDKELPFEFLMEYLRDKLEEEGYRLVHSDRKIHESGKKVEKLEKYHLKPPISSEVPIDQLYGNIIIELFHKNNIPDRIRLMANVYSDRLYKEPKNFGDLINVLFDQRTSR